MAGSLELSGASDKLRPVRWRLPSLLVLTACAGAPQAAKAPEIGSSRASPISPHQGRYRIERDGQPVGHERYTVTSSAGLWIAEGEIQLAWPLDQTQRYRFEYDLEARRPRRFQVQVELLDEAQTVTGDCDGRQVAGEVTGIVAPERYEVAYGSGTMIDFGSPLFSALVFALLGPALESAEPIKLRSIVIPIPFLRPAVLLQELRFAGRDGDLRKVALGPHGRKPAAFWLRADGLPVRVKTWADEGGAPFVYELEP